MFRICFFLFIIITSLSTPLLANETYTRTFVCHSKSKENIKSYQINEHELYFVLCNGKKITPPKAENQESVGDLRVSKDNKWIGWAVSVPNCCTSYPVPTSLHLYNNGKFYTVNSDGQMIWNWYFSEENGKVLLEQGTVHGMSEPNIDEYDIKTGKKLRHIKDGN